MSEAAEDIRFLGTLSTRQGGAIFGLVRFVSPGPQVGTIIESGADGEHKARVSASRVYEVSGLTPGDYRETFIPDDPDAEYVGPKHTIPVNGSCAESGVRLGNVPVSVKSNPRS